MKSAKLPSLILASLLLVLCRLAGAQIIFPMPADQVVLDTENTTTNILSFTTGQTIAQTAPFYDRIDDELIIQGRFHEIPSYMDVSHLRVVINGVDILQFPGAVFGIDPPVGATSEGGFTVQLPLPSFQSVLPLYDVQVELVYIPNDQTISRARISLYDLRFPSPTSPVLTDAPTVPEVGINYQMSNYGLGGDGDGDPAGIEQIVAAEYPTPSLEAFNSLLADYARDLRDRDQTDLKVCIDYEDLDTDQFRRISEFPAYRSALIEAWTVYAAYQACQKNGGIGCNQACVTSRPRARDFELCVNTISGQPVSAQVEDFTDLELKFINGQSPGLIEADMKFAGFEANVDLHLSDLRVRWRQSGCLGRPSAQLDNSEINSREWLEAWTTCPNTLITAGTAKTRHIDGIPAQFSINQDPTDAHRLYISDYQLAEFGFEEVSHDAAIGTCALDFISSEADSFLTRFTRDVLATLATTVNDGQPQTDMSRLVDEAFGEVAIGLVGTDFYDLNATINSIATSDVHGLMVDWETLIQPLTVEDAGRLRGEYISQGAMLPPWLSEHSLDALGNTISSKFGMNTFWINQVLWAGAATPILNRPLSFSVVELGIGSDPNTIVTEFDGQVLADLHPGFADLAGTTVELYLERQLDPMVVQPPDPSAMLPNVGWPIYFGTNGLRLYVKGPDKIDINGNLVSGSVYVSLDLNVYDETFSMESGETVGDEFLAPMLSSARWQVSVLDMDFPDCPKFSHESPQNRQGSCEAGMESALYLFLEPKLDAVMAELLGQIPAPQHYALEGDSDLQLQTKNISRLHQFGTLDVFDLLAP